MNEPCDRDICFREIERRFADHRREHELLAKQVDEARKEIDRRLAEMNQFRKQIDDERMHYLTKDEYDKAHGVLAEKISDIKVAQGRIFAVAAFAVVIAGIVASILDLVKR